MRRGLKISLAVLGGLSAAALVAYAMMPRPKPGHTLLHINCKHHAHGAPWFAGHGRSLSYERPVGAPRDEPIDLKARGITASRPPAR